MTTAPLALTVDLNVPDVDLAAVVGTRMVTDQDGYADEEPLTLGQAIAAQVAENLTKAEEYPGLKRQVLQARLDEIRAQLQPVVAEALAAPIQRTNNYGEPAGGTTTLRELVVAEVRNVLNKKDRHDQGTTFVEKIIREQVTRALTQELSEAIGAEKAKVVAAVRASAATLIAKAVQDGLGTR